MKNSKNLEKGWNLFKNDQIKIKKEMKIMTCTLRYDILSLFRPRLSSSREKLREKNWTHKVSFDTSLRVGGPSRPKSKSTFFSLMAHFEQNSFLTCCNGLKSILSESNIWKIRFHSQSLWYTHRFVIVNLAYLRYGKLEENWQWCICNCSFTQHVTGDAFNQYFT